MRIIFLLVLIVGLGLSGFGVYMLSQKFNSDQAELARLRAMVANQTELGPVVVTTQQVRYGQALQPEHVSIVEWPLNARPQNVFTSIEELFGPEGTPSRAVLRLVEPGEPLLRSKVTNPGEDAGVSSRLSKGMRAYTITVDVASGVSGFLNPGDRVDIFWSGRDRGEPITKLILENISLIAIDQIADEDTKRPIVARTVTVEVSPQIVTALAQAQQTGRMTLSLRGADDDATSGPIEIDQDTLLGRVDDVVVQEKECFITVRKGGESIKEPRPCQPGE